MSGVLVLAEVVLGKPSSLSLELLGLARRLVASTGGSVCALTFGPDDTVPVALLAHGADRVIAVDEPQAADYDSDVWTSCAAAAVARESPYVVLAGHTTKGMDLAPRLAFRLNSAAAMGCTSVEREGEQMRFTRPCYGGNFRELIAIRTRPAVATVRGGAYDAWPEDAARSGEVAALRPDMGSRLRVVERRQETSETVRLEDARVVVAGGRGLDGPDGFKMLRELAGALGGVVGASRVPCDLGWCPHSMQIGLTGKTVTPDLYIAVGISGAGHHMAGCGGARNIVAINTDRDAAIFRDARFGIVGDYREVVPALVAEITKSTTMTG